MGEQGPKRALGYLQLHFCDPRGTYLGGVIELDHCDVCPVLEFH